MNCIKAFLLGAMVMGGVFISPAQTPFVQREQPTGRLLLDPRGDRPVSINDPRPFVVPVPSPAVTDFAREANYFYWEGNDGWVFHHRVIRERDNRGMLQSETRISADHSAPIQQRTFQYSATGLLSAAATWNPDERVRQAGFEEWSRNYDPATGLLLREVRRQVTEGIEHTFTRRFEPEWDSKSSLVHLTTYANYDTLTYEPIRYSFEFDGERLSEMVQYLWESPTGTFVPSFRYSDFSFRNDSLIGFHTYADDLDGWKKLKADTTYVESASETVYQTRLLDEGSKSITCRLTTDAKGNLVRMEQTGKSGETLSTTELHITYEEGRPDPSEVIGTYLDSSGTQIPAVKVVYRYGPSAIDEQTTLYPNPASSSVQWRFNHFDSESCRYELLDPSGNSIRTGTLKSETTGAFRLSLDDIAVGNYLLKVADAEHQEVLLLSVIR